MDKTSISVPTLQRMLGLKKGAAYWLIKQGHFEIVIVGKKMRVMLDSFLVLTKKMQARSCCTTTISKNFGRKRIILLIFVTIHDMVKIKK